MLKEWQFNVLFFVGVGGAIMLLIGPEFGLKIGQNPTAVTGVGAILTYILTQRKSLTKHDKTKPPEDSNDETGGSDDGS
jgi:hypothetical protein